MTSKNNNLVLTLELHQIREEEVRRGWIRIHENMRASIPAEDIVYLKGPAGGVFRVVLGLPNGYRVGDTPARIEWICMDEPTRNVLGLKDQPVGSKVTVTIRRRAQPVRTWYWIRYSLNHPEIPLKTGSWLAVVLGGLSLVLGITSVVLGALSLRH